MNVLVLKTLKEDPETWSCEYGLEYKEGDIWNDDNYIRDLVDSDYNVEFDYKGLSFNDGFIVEALTYFFDKQCQNGEIISYEDLQEIFTYHMEVKDTEEITKIKRICVEYAIGELNSIHFRT